MTKLLITQASTWPNVSLQFSTIEVSFAPEVACREELGQRVRRRFAAADPAHLEASDFLGYRHPQPSSHLQVSLHRLIVKTYLPICVQPLFRKLSLSSALIRCKL